MKPKLFIV